MRRSLVPILFAKPGWVLPGATLDMDFANNRAWRKGNGLSLPASLLTTARASTGYAATSSGLLVPFLSNIPRITDLGLLVEQAATNLALQSQALANAAWKVTGGGVGSAPTVTANQAAAPDGTVTATRIQFALNGGTTSSDLSATNQNSNITTTNTSTYTFSVWMKSNTASTYTIYLEDAPTGLRQSATVTPTWTRFSLVYVASAASNPTINLWGGQTPASSNSADLLVWGAQLELGSFPTSYIPTTTVAVTRAIDNEAAAAALLTALQSASGTVIMSVGGGVAAAVGTILGINALIGLGKTAADKLTTAFGGAQTSGNTATWTGNNKVGLRWSANAVAICLNGGTIVTAANAPPAVTSANIGSTSGSSAAVNQFIKRLTVIPSSVSDATFQALTT